MGEFMDRLKKLPAERQKAVFCGLIWGTWLVTGKIDPSLIAQYGWGKLVPMLLRGSLVHLDSIFYQLIGQYYKLYFLILIGLAGLAGWMLLSMR